MDEVLESDGSLDLPGSFDALCDGVTVGSDGADGWVSLTGVEISLRLSLSDTTALTFPIIGTAGMFEALFLDTV